ncbi:hypothetical protein FKP32DRAFT_98991 [Trametes sanguinea]|nr:hypothetical protein FKP32DRAFT_98991 [Trametes sanguinea]
MGPSLSRGPRNPPSGVLGRTVSPPGNAGALVASCAPLSPDWDEELIVPRDSRSGASRPSLREHTLVPPAIHRCPCHSKPLSAPQAAQPWG